MVKTYQSFPTLTLCTHTGNNYGMGETRTRELTGSCGALGIDGARCVALDHPELQDHPSIWWNTALIATLVDEYVRAWNVDAVSPSPRRCNFCLFAVSLSG